MNIYPNKRLNEKLYLPKEFPFQIFEAAIFNDAKEKLHWHDFLEINYIKSGTGKYIISEKEYNLAEKDVIIINRGELHKMLEKNNIELLVIIFDPTLLQSSIRFPFEVRVLTPFDVVCEGLSHRLNDMKGQEEEVRNIMNEIENEFSKKDIEYELLIRSSLERLMVIFMRYCFYYSTSSYIRKERIKALQSINPALEHINSNFLESIELSDLAKACNMSVSWFSKIFKTALGVSAISYLNRIRIQYAVNLLKNTDFKVADIAYESGFNNISSFVRYFKIVTGVTPKEIR